MSWSKLQTSIAKGQEWLEQRKQTWISETENGLTFHDNFVELLMMELSGRWDYVNLRIPPRRWNYFGSTPVIVPADYPDDNDTNAVAFSIIKPTESRAKELIDEIAKCTNEKGIIQVHLDPNRPRIAPEVSANILTLFYTYGRGDEVRHSLEYLQQALNEPEYSPSRYYFIPEPLFYFCWRLLNTAASASNMKGSLGYRSQDKINDSALPPELHPVRKRLVERVQDRIGVRDGDNALCPAIRLLLCQSLGINNEADLELLLSLQEKSGGFGKGWYVRYGSCGIRISHPGFVGVIAVEALKRRLASELL